jgi:hypothetical protein
LLRGKRGDILNVLWVKVCRRVGQAHYHGLHNRRLSWEVARLETPLKDIKARERWVEHSAIVHRVWYIVSWRRVDGELSLRSCISMLVLLRVETPHVRPHNSHSIPHLNCWLQPRVSTNSASLSICFLMAHSNLLLGYIRIR